MKVVFLDIDGVLNRLALIGSGGRPLDRLDAAAVSRLGEIVARSGAKVVISSSWRAHRTLDELRAMLSELGFSGEVIDKTPELEASLYGDPFLVRAREIKAWIEAQREPIESYVILDDAYLDEAAQHLVKTETTAGLLDEHVALALEILGERHS
ncbi:MAG: hypothetical protein HUU21_07145 [Polyangiaceae bacterium]|nr:hypothetical protein [Polyangiaceae bacterium]